MSPVDTLGPEPLADRPDHSPTLDETFIRLRDRWQSETRHFSSTTRRVLHPAYQAIIGLGPAAVPLLLRELEQNVDSWFWALHAITREDPAPDDARGDGDRIARAWMEWEARRLTLTKSPARRP